MSGKTIALLVLGGAVLLIVLCLGLIVWRIQRLKRAVAIARLWPTAPGRIVSGAIDVRNIALPRGRSVSFGAIIGYEYEVGGRRYRSTRYSLSGPHYFSFERGAKRLLAKFPVGAAVRVSYDPAKPEDGVIALRAPFVFALWAVFWTVIVLVTPLVGGVLLFEPMFGPEPLIRL